jgi:ABC-type multidrug transport system fused ATPase/permease subunit
MRVRCDHIYLTFLTNRIKTDESQYILYLTEDITAHYIEDWQTGGPEPMSRDRLLLNLKRIAIASGPWQQWALHVRSVYRWEDPYETFRWMILYAYLWYTSHIIGFVYGYIVFATLYRYFFPSADDLKESVMRARNSTQKSQRIDQLIQNPSPDDWLQVFENDLGPWLQMQLGDLASLFEIINNFYEWASPRQTLHSVIFFALLLLITLLGDMEVCVRIVLLLLGVCFFGSLPISSRWPKYRFIMSPLRWAWWNVPNNAEWAFAELRLASQNKREGIIAAKIEDEFHGDSDSSFTDAEEEAFISAPEDEGDMLSENPPLKEDDVISSFRCKYDHHRAQLVFFANGLRMVVSKRVLWSRTWYELKAVRKLKKKRNLELEWTDGETVEVEGLGHRRDQVFAQVIGECPVYMRAKS